jgi:hypothetical protein
MEPSLLHVTCRRRESRELKQGADRSFVRTATTARLFARERSCRRTLPHDTCARLPPQSDFFERLRGRDGYWREVHPKRAWAQSLSVSREKDRYRCGDERGALIDLEMTCTNYEQRVSRLLVYSAPQEPEGAAQLIGRSIASAIRRHNGSLTALKRPFGRNPSLSGSRTRFCSPYRRHFEG